MAINIPIVTQFDGKGIKKAIAQFKQLETNGQKAAFVLKKAGQAAALGFAAVGVAAAGAAKLMWDFATMARQDQLAQVRLAGTLKATTKATDAQIAGVEKFIDVTQRATGVADDQLRPALGRLVRATKDVSKAQQLLKLALDISGRTGKPLETVVNALGKAYEGSNTALGKLGLGYSKAELKAKSFATIQEELNKKFSGGANEQAKTFEGTMARFKITLDELKESAGTVLLTPLTKLVDAGIRIADAFGTGGATKAVQQLKYELQTLLYDSKGNLNSVGETLNKIISVLNGLGSVVNKAGNQFKLPLKLVNAIPGVDLKLPHYGKLGKLDTQIDPRQLLAATSSSKQTVMQGGGVGAAARSGIVVNVYVSPLANPADVGRNVKKTLDALDRRGR